jgi:hypothetical protein
LFSFTELPVQDDHLSEIRGFLQKARALEASGSLLGLGKLALVKK